MHVITNSKNIISNEVIKIISNFLIVLLYSSTVVQYIYYTYLNRSNIKIGNHFRLLWIVGKYNWEMIEGRRPNKSFKNLSFLIPIPPLQSSQTNWQMIIDGSAQLAPDDIIFERFYFSACDESSANAIFLTKNAQSMHKEKRTRSSAFFLFLHRDFYYSKQLILLSFSFLFFFTSKVLWR